MAGANGGVTPVAILEAVHERPVEDYLSDVDALDVPALRETAYAHDAYPALRSIMGTYPADFHVRLGALKTLIDDSRAYIPSGDLRDLWFWLNDQAYDTVQRNLRNGGWIEHDGTQGWYLTDLGHRYYQVLLFLAKQNDEQSLEDSLVFMEALQEMNVGEDAALLAVRSKLKQVLINVEQASKVFSAVLLKRYEDHAAKAIEIGREVIKRVEPLLFQKDKRPIIVDLHKTLSELGPLQATLSKNRVMVLEQEITLPSGVRIEDVTRALMDMTKEDLEAPMRQALKRSYMPPPFVNTSSMVDGALEFMGQVRMTPLEDLAPARAAQAVDIRQLPDQQESREYLRLLQGLLDEERDEWLIQDIVDAPQARQTLMRIALSSLTGSRQKYRKGTLMGEYSDLPLEYVPGSKVIDVNGKTLRMVSNAKLRRIKL